MRNRVGVCCVRVLAALVVAFVWGDVPAQEAPAEEDAPPAANASLRARGMRGVQPAKQGQGFRLTPRLDTSLTWTDNAEVGHVASPQGKSSDWILEVSPGFSITGDRGRFKGVFNARWRNLGYLHNDKFSESFGTIQGVGSIEAVKDVFFVDLNADVNRNNRQPFYGRPSDDDMSVGKDQETRLWGVSPRLQFRLGSAAKGMVRYRTTWYDSNLNNFGNQREQTLTGQLGNESAIRHLGWNLDYTNVRTNYEKISDETGRTVGRGTVFVNFARQFRVRLIGGHESYDNVQISGKDSGTIGGGGFDWYPTPRTTISALAEKRVFGTGYNVALKHRLRHAYIDISGIRDISSMSDTDVYLNPDFLALIGNPNFEPGITDPVERARRARMIYSPTADGVTNALFRNQTWRAAVTFNGLRNSLTVSGIYTKRRRLLDVSLLSVGDVFSATENYDTKAAAVSYMHRLTPLSSLHADLTGSRSEGDSSTLDTRRVSASLGVQSQLGPQTHGGVTYRYLRSESDTATYDYIENSVKASLGMSF